MRAANGNPRVPEPLALRSTAGASHPDDARVRGVPTAIVAARRSSRRLLRCSPHRPSREHRDERHAVSQKWRSHCERSTTDTDLVHDHAANRRVRVHQQPFERSRRAECDHERRRRAEAKLARLARRGLRHKHLANERQSGVSAAETQLIRPAGELAPDRSCRKSAMSGSRTFRRTRSEQPWASRWSDVQESRRGLARRVTMRRRARRPSTNRDTRMPVGRRPMQPARRADAAGRQRFRSRFDVTLDPACGRKRDVDGSALHSAPRDSSTS